MCVCVFVCIYTHLCSATLKWKNAQIMHAEALAYDKERMERYRSYMRYVDPMYTGSML